MAGFWHLSHHQLRDLNGAVYAGAKAYFFEADTLASIIVYQDYGLGTPHPNPVEANSAGIFPPVFFDEVDGFYRQRLTTSGGVIIPGTDVGTLPIIGPGVGGGGAEVPVDENALLKVGDLFWQPMSGSRAGFVRANNRSIGSATSGATERANADCEQLFLEYHGRFSDTICPVSGGRGVSAAADWAANKQLQLLDMRFRDPRGLDDMGNTAAGRSTGVPFTVGGSTTPGAQCGEAVHQLLAASLPVITPTTASITQPAFLYERASVGSTTPAGTGGATAAALLASTSTAVSQTQNVAVTMNSFGSNGSHNTTGLCMLGTWYIKL